MLQVEGLEREADACISATAVCWLAARGKVPDTDVCKVVSQQAQSFACCYPRLPCLVIQVC